MNFKEKVQSMTAKEIIMAMVDSLTHPPTIRVDMHTFGETKPWKLFGFIPTPIKVCFGCAATNTICEISSKKFNTENITHLYRRAEFLNVDTFFLEIFECAIDNLRCGKVPSYNICARRGVFAGIQNPLNTILPILSTDYTNEDLIPYRQLADSQISIR